PALRAGGEENCGVVTAGTVREHWHIRALGAVGGGRRAHILAGLAGATPSAGLLPLLDVVLVRRPPSYSAARRRADWLVRAGGALHGRRLCLRCCRSAQCR